MDDKIKTLHALYSGQQTLCQYRLRRFVRLRKTFCQDRFMQHFSHADRLRRFVRKTFCQGRLTGGHEWLWAVMDD